MVKHFNTPRGVFKAVDGVDVDVEASGIIALLGPSGSGKTTLLRLIAGLESPTGGRIMFDDEDATSLSVQERQIGFVFQSYALFNHKTVAENIKFGLEVGSACGNCSLLSAELLECHPLFDAIKYQKGDTFPEFLPVLGRLQLSFVVRVRVVQQRNDTLSSSAMSVQKHTSMHA
jgi:ABC-type sugar transport system ATPase subunit